MSGFGWRDPRFLIGAGVLLLVLAVAYALDFTRRRHLMDKIGHAPQLLRMAASVSAGRRRLKAALMVLGVALVTLALARPQTEGERLWRQRGIDMALVLDFSKSMLAQDVDPRNRVERSKLEADAILDKFGGDRVGVVAFGGGAVRYPLTTDHEAAKSLYHSLDPRDMAPGSDIAEGIRTARCLLLPNRIESDCARVRTVSENALHGDKLKVAGAADLGDRGRAIIVFTDGEQTAGSARAEVQRAAQLGIEVYFVGVGTKEGARIPEYSEDGTIITGWKKNLDGTTYHTSHLDEAGLKELARAGGGEDHYFHADPRRLRFSLEGLVKALGKLKEGNIEERTASIPSEAYQYVLFPGFLVLVIEACLSDRRRRRRRDGAHA